MMRTLGSLIALALIVALQTGSPGQIAAGQDAPGIRVKGVVTDDAGGVLPQAVVTFRGGKLQRKVASREDGSFDVELAPGVYRVSAKAAGCREFKMKGLNVQAGAPIDLDVRVKCPPTPIY